MKNLTTIIMCFIAGYTANAQIRAIGGEPASVLTSSAFLDASSNATYDGSVNSAKGIVFPRVDLTTFTSFLGVNGTSSSFRNRYDGFIVYNTATTGVAGVGATSGTLSRGFWYYDNSTAGVGAGTIGGGTWKAVGSTATKDVTTTEVALSTKVNGAQLYAISGTFTASGTSTAVTIAVPAGMTGYYSLVTYLNGKTFRREIYSFDIVATTNNVIMGTGAYSEVYPAGTYSYVLEYFK
jgi:hypothetical protein